MTVKYNTLNEQWHGPVMNNDLIKYQEKIAKNISYGLFGLSTLFISAGRLSELFISKPKEEPVKRKLRNRAVSRMRRGRKLK
jgi:hypothetical protein